METKYRVWWITNFPAEPFHYEVASPEEAAKVIYLLSMYDLYLGDLVVTNVQGLEYYDAAEDVWYEWYDDEDEDIGSYDRNFKKIVYDYEED